MESARKEENYCTDTRLLYYTAPQSTCKTYSGKVGHPTANSIRLCPHGAEGLRWSAHGHWYAIRPCVDDSPCSFCLPVRAAGNLGQVTTRADGVGRECRSREVTDSLDGRDARGSCYRIYKLHSRTTMTTAQRHELQISLHTSRTLILFVDRHSIFHKDTDQAFPAIPKV